ncbi:MAG: exodeoxyribonuclease VII large subunit [Chloroflexi bacterium]|nr:exodeoxyribonuclease VII large subunit [Chloroflexota bacterium]
MQQLSFFESPQVALSVVELTKHIRQLMEADELLQDVWVAGEVSNLSQPKSGHMYFTLKDSEASLRCVMWRNAVAQLAYLPNDGDAVEIHGNVSVYEASGQYQLYVDTIRPAGQGALYQEFLQLKAKLEAEGLFDPERKRPIPHWPERIGIVTSPTGAALRDMLNTLRRRFPLTQVVLAPATVQGQQAPAEITSAIERLNAVIKPDVILVARGGGSIEDLWAFNDENVARAIAASDAPVISGVGHETDFTIADFTADLRATTPTAAAELATPDQFELRADLDDIAADLVVQITAALNTQRIALDTVGNRLRMVSPMSRVRRDRQRLDELLRRVEVVIVHRSELLRAGLTGLEQRLLALSPQGVLGRGYAFVSDANGRGISSVKDIDKGDALDIQVADGRFGVEVTRKHSKGKR